MTPGRRIHYIWLRRRRVKEVFATMFQDEALVVKSLLDSAGIESRIAGEHILDVYPMFAPELRGIKIVTADEDEEDALAVVADYASSRSRGETDAPPGH